MLITILLILISLVWGVFAWKKPEDATLYLPLWLPTYVIRTSLGPFPTTLLELVLLALIIGVTITKKNTIWKIGLKKTKPWHIPILFWIIATLISIYIAPDHLAALGLWRAYVLEPLLYFVLLSGILKPTNRSVLIRSLVAVVTIVALWAVFQFVTNIGIPEPWNTEIFKRRATGPYPFPNALSLFAAPIAALCFGIILNRHPRKNEGLSEKFLNHNFHENDDPDFKDRDETSLYLWSWIGFISGSISTLLAKSMGGTLAILTAMFVVLIWHKRTRLITLIVTCFSIVTILMIPALRTPIVRNLSFQDWSGKVRLIIWEESWNMLKDRPFFGAGLGAYPEVIKPYHKATFIEIFQYPHNILFNLWSETGLLGILAFTWIIAVWLKLILRTEYGVPSTRYRVRGTRYLVPLIAILVQGLVDVPYFKNDLAILFWIFVALTTKINQVADKKNYTIDKKNSDWWKKENQKT